MDSAMGSTELPALKVLHDQLLAKKPDGADHDPAACPLCAYSEDTGGGDGRPDVSAAADEATIKAAVDEATKPLLARIAELEKSAETSEQEAAVAAVRAEYEGKLSDLQAQLDGKVLEAQTEKERADLLVAWLEGEKEAQEQAAELASRKDERLAKIKEVASFPDEYLSEHAERFAAMSDDDFATTLESWKAIGAKKDGEAGDRIPSGTALHAARDSEPARGGSALKEVIGLRRNGRVDLSSL